MEYASIHFVHDDKVIVYSPNAKALGPHGSGGSYVQAPMAPGPPEGKSSETSGVSLEKWIGWKLGLLVVVGLCLPPTPVLYLLTAMGTILGIAHILVDIPVLFLVLP